MPNNCASIVIAAKHHELTKVKDTRGTTNTVGALRCKFDFRTDDWQHSVKTAMFCNGDANLHPEVIDDAIAVRLDDDNVCPVPYEVLTDTLPYSIGVWGITDSGLRVVSNWLVFNAQVGCYTQGNVPSDPKPTIYEEILITSQNAVDTANEVVNRANNGDFNGADGESAYEIAIKNGFKGSEVEWLRSLKGEKGDPTQVVQSIGLSTTAVMSQKATSNELAKKANDDDVVKKSSIVSNTTRAYVIQNGENGTVEIINSNKANTIPRRYTDGRLRVGDPVEAQDAVNKQYAEESFINKNDIKEYVKNTDYATDSKGGVVKVYEDYGVSIGTTGILFTARATEAEIDSRTQSHKAIVPSNLEYAVKSVAYSKDELDDKFGDIDTVLDNIITIQEELIIPNGDEITY